MKYFYVNHLFFLFIVRGISLTISFKLWITLWTMWITLIGISKTLDIRPSADLNLCSDYIKS
jgi:hypothetical protein